MERRPNGCAQLLCSLLLAQLVSSLKVTNLPEGLLTKKMDMKLTSKTWKVIITVEDGSTQWDDIMRVVKSLSHLTHPLMDDWTKSQLQQLGARICHLGHSRERRHRRGLIDGLGQILHSVLGLATDGEVAELKEKIEQNRQWQRTMSTWSEKLIVVINKTHEDMVSTRAMLHNITQVTLNAINDVHLIMTLHDQVHRLELIERRTSEVMEDLERGQLTELLLPRDVLASIVDGSLPYEWYYRWGTITPLWNSGLVFETRLPIVSQDPILGYEHVTFPVWGPGNRTVRLDIAKHAALDTRTGLVYEPRACRGMDPVVCSQGPNERHGCASAVVTEQLATALQVCHVIDVMERRRIFSLAENELVTVLRESTLFSQHCPASNEPFRVTLGRGTHRVAWQSGCRLETEDFTITATPMPVGHRQVTGWYVPPGAINLVNYFSNITYPSVLPNLIPLNIDTLPSSPVIHWHDDLNIVTLVKWIVIVVLCILMVVILTKMYGLQLITLVRRRCSARSKPREAAPDVNTVTETLEMVCPSTQPQPFTFKSD